MKKLRIIQYFFVVAVICVGFALLEGGHYAQNAVNSQSAWRVKDPQYDTNRFRDPIELLTPSFGETRQERNSVFDGQIMQLTSFASGAGSTITYDLSFSTIGIHRFKLPAEDIFALAFSWDDGDFSYGFGDVVSIPQMNLIEIDHHHNPNRLNSELIFPEAENSYVYIEPKERVTDLRLDIIDPTHQQSSFTVMNNADSGAKYSTLPIVSRNEWGGTLAPPDIDDPSRLTWDPYYYHVDKIIVHHTVTPNEPSNPEDYVRSVYLFHANTKGWGDVGYNYLIDHNGTIYEGKLGGEEVKGFHAGSTANRGSIGIALLGDFTSESPTNAAKDALKKLMAEKAAFFDFNLLYGDRNLNRWNNETYTVFGHRDSFNRREVETDVWEWQVENTACPGNTFYEELNTVTQQAQTYKSNHFATIKAVVQEVNDTFQYDHQPEVIGVTFDLDDPDEAEVRALIPDFSGISVVTVSKNVAILRVDDWDNGGFVPPLGWIGWEDVQTYFPAAAGSEDRIKTLMKLFLLDDDVLSVSLNHYGEFID